MTTPQIHKHEQHWWEEIDELDVSYRNLRGMDRVIRQGLLADRKDIRTARGNRRYTRHL